MIRRVIKIMDSYPSKLILLALAYFVSVHLSLLLSMPPEFVSPIWIPAGISLTAVLLGGYKYLPGVFIGALFTTVIISVDSSGNLVNLRSVLTAVFISFGASLQAAVAAFLIKMVILPDKPLLEDEKEVGKIIILGGPIGCVINSTLGTIAL